MLLMGQLARLAGLAWGDLRRGAVGGAVSLLLFLHVLVLFMCAHPTFPLWSGLMVPLMKRRFGEALLHYPDAFIGLPTSGFALRLVVDLLAGPWVAVWVAACVLLVARGLPARARVLRTYPSAVVLTFVVGTIWILLYSLPVSRLLRNESLDYMVRLAAAYGGGLIPALVVAPLLYCIPILLQQGGSLVAAVRESAAMFRRLPFLTLALSATPYLMGVPFSWATDRSAEVAASLRPEIVLALAVMQAIVAVGAGYFVVQSGARLWAHRSGSR